jgi:hypothetical protein
VIGTVAWLALGGAIVVWQVVCRTSGGRYPGLGALALALGRRWPGWVALTGMWAFAGWHLFARYTVPR